MPVWQKSGSSEKLLWHPDVWAPSWEIWFNMGGGEADRGMTPLTIHILKGFPGDCWPWGSVLVTSKICKARTALPVKWEGSPSGARKVCERAAQHPKAAGPGGAAAIFSERQPLCQGRGLDWNELARRLVANPRAQKIDIQEDCRWGGPVAWSGAGSSPKS